MSGDRLFGGQPSSYWATTTCGSYELLVKLRNREETVEAPFSELSMEFLQSLLPDAGRLRLDSYDIENGDRLTLSLSSIQTVVPCPLCGGFTQRVHSRYERTLADLPCVHFSLRLVIQVCKFFCSTPECQRRIFTERQPTVAVPWSRKTRRFVQRLQAIGLALGGAAGAR